MNEDRDWGNDKPWEIPAELDDLDREVLDMWMKSRRHGESFVPGPPDAELVQQYKTRLKLAMLTFAAAVNLRPREPKPGEEK